MKLLIIDTETTGLKVSDGHEAIEVGAILYSVPFRAPLQSVSFLLPTETNDAAHINGIDPALTNLDQPWRTALALFREMAAVADFALAHNAEFDSKWFGVGHLAPLHLQWICSLADLNWGELPGRSLRDLALAHGIAVMPEVHRALPDCQLLAAVLSKRDDLEELIDLALLPKATYRAVVSFADRDQAKSRGFRWNPDTKHWLKRLTDEEVHRLREEGLQLQPVGV
jgi:DNA polymerase III subunit epsilon